MAKVLFLMIVLCWLLPFELSAGSPAAGNPAARNHRDIIGDTFEETAGRGLVVNTNPVGVRVFIDGVERGLSPIAFNALDAGEYQIRLYREGYRERVFYVTTFDHRRIVVSIEMEESRSLANVAVHREQGSPAALTLNSQITVTGVESSSPQIIYAGENQAVFSLPLGYNTLRVQAFGWEDVTVDILITENETADINIYMTPASFRLKNPAQSRRRFNPLNAGNLGRTEFRFEVSAPGTGAVIILNDNNEEVFRENLGPFESRHQRITWNGRDVLGNPLPQGIYSVVIDASGTAGVYGGGGEASSLTLQTEINYSTNIIPLSPDSGVSGLLFAPVPHVLPSGSFQLSAGIFAGSFLPPQTIQPGDAAQQSVIGFPFKINMRLSAINRLELSASFNINPFLDNQIGLGVSGSAKYNFFSGNNIPLYFAAGVSYAWAAENGEAPLSPGPGIGLHAPISLELNSFSIIFCPSLFWRGPEGLTPAVLFSAGVLYRRNWLNAGLSARGEFDFTANETQPRFLAGAEIHLFPPPSYIVFSIMGGVWTQGQKTGGYGGFRIGVIQ